MFAKLTVVFSAIAISNALPPLFTYNFGIPHVVFGLNNGLNNNVVDISQSIASSQSGKSYGVGNAASGNINRGNYQGIAHGYQPAVRPLNQQQSAAAAFSSSLGKDYGAATSFAQNSGNSGLSLSSAQNLNGFGSASSFAQNSGVGKPQSAVSQALNGHKGLDSAAPSVSSSGLGLGVAQSSAQNIGGHGSAYSQSQNQRLNNFGRPSPNGSGFGVAQSAAQNVGGYGSSYALSQNQGQNSFGSAISGANNNGNFESSFAQSSQQHGRHQQQSSASSVNAPGIQAAQSFAINNGFY